MRAFGDWAQANKDNPDIKDPVFSFLCEAEDILSGGTVSQKAAFDPKVSNLTDELVYQSGSVIGFDDRAKARLVLVQEKYTDEEITAVFKEWFSSLDTSNPKNVSFGGKNFAEIASQHCYALHRTREEKAAEGLARQKAVERLQEAANAERQESERKRQAEAEAAEIPLPI
jgi:TPR repeat protein